MRPLWYLNDVKITDIWFSPRWTFWARTASHGCLLELTISPMRVQAWNAMERIALMRDASCCGIAKCAVLIILHRILMVMGFHAGMAFLVALLRLPPSDPELGHGFIYICHSMSPGPPLHWVECLRSSPRHLNLVHSASGTGSFLQLSCPSHWAGGNLHWWRPALPSHQVWSGMPLLPSLCLPQWGPVPSSHWA